MQSLDSTAWSLIVVTQRQLKEYLVHIKPVKDVVTYVRGKWKFFRLCGRQRPAVECWGSLQVPLVQCLNMNSHYHDAVHHMQRNC